MPDQGSSKRRAMTSWVLLVLLIPSLQTFAQPAPSRQDTPTRLVVGQPLTGVIDDGAPVVETETLAARYKSAPTVGRAFALEVDDGGPVTLELRSYFFDAYLVLRAADGALIAEDDDGLVGTQSRLVAVLAPGTSYRVEACALHGKRGAFELTVARGEPPVRSPAEQIALEIDDGVRRVQAIEAAEGSESLALADALDSLGLDLWHGGDYRRGREVFERALAIQQAVLGPDHPDVANSLNNLAGALWRLGDLEAARPLLERALAIDEEVYGPRHPEVAIGLNNLATLLTDLGDLAAARPLCERALAIKEAVLGPEHPDVAITLNNLANLLKELGDLAAARTLYQRALTIFEATLGPEHPDVAAGLTNLAQLLKDLGDLAAARPLHERALAIWEAALGPEHPVVGMGLTNLAQLLTDLGDFDAARPLIERALTIREATLGPEHPDVASSLINLAQLVTDLGDFAAARPLLERALAIRQAALGPEHPDVAICLNDLGTLLMRLGDLVGARPPLERALTIYEAVYGPEHPEVATGLNNLAMMLRELGDSAGARLLLERALTIYEAAYGPEHPEVASSLNNLAILLWDLGDHAAARPLQDRVLTIFEAAYGPEHPRVALSLNNLALLIRDLGDLTAARPLFERALAIWEATLGPDHPDVALALNNLADLLRKLGDFAAARPLFERTLTTWEATLGPDHPRVAATLINLVLLLLDNGEPEVGLRYARQLARRRSRVRQTLASLTTGESHLYLAKLRLARNALLTVAAAAGDHAAAYDTTLRSKGQVARLTLQTRTQIRDALDPATLERVEALARIQARLSRLALETDVRDRAAHDTLLESLRVERDGLERELRRSADVGEEQAVTSADVAAALPAAAAVVDLLVHARYIPARLEDGEVIEPGLWSEPRVGAWVVRPGAVDVAWVDLGPASAIEAATKAFLEDLVARRGVMVADEGEGGADVNATLRTLVWDPLVPHLDGADTIFLSPDGVLGTLPYETLRDETGRFLIETRAFVYPTEVASMVERPASVEPLGGGSAPLLAIGGVDFRKRAEIDALESSATVLGGTKGGGAAGGGSADPVPSDALRGSFARYWGRLPATEYESQVVTDMHEDALLDEASRLLLLGADATEERLKAEMPRHAILHLATHGFFQPEGLPSMWEQALDTVSDERDGPGFADGDMRMTETAARLTGLHPGLLSGLVLAGANRPPEDDATDPDAPLRDDGYLTASEVTLLDLSNVDLVVLSACETGLGRPQSGEGLLGLRRAFHMAGADTVISSLWSVKDESTSELMQSFYANLFFKGMGRHEALRAAQLEMLQRNRMEHGDALPSTWGAFVLSGEWR